MPSWLFAEDSKAASQPELLFQRIDRYLSDAHLGPVAERTDDAEFLRRVSLDLIGRVPTIAELDAFLADPSPDRRGTLVDRLLASPECDKHLATLLDVTWMERRPDFYVQTPAWRDYLRQAIAKGQPLHELVAEILAADGADEATKARAKFLVDRNVESHLLTRDVARMFFGRDLQCAQCHDHPLISDYEQEEYYGLFAYLQRSFLVTMDAEKKLVSVGEKAEGDAVFTSVFEPDVPQQTALPALPDGSPVIEEPTVAVTQAYLVAPADKVQAVPRFSRRERLAEAARLAESQFFRRNAANRLWRLLMKRGLVEPPDLMHADNPPTHPLLLDELAQWLASHEFAVKPFLAQIARSEAYQRRIEVPLPDVVDADLIRAKHDEWNRESSYQQQWLQRIDRDLSAATSRRRELEQQFFERRTQLLQKLTEQEAAAQKRTEAQAKQQAAETERQAKRTTLAALQASAEQARAAATQLASDEELAAAATLLENRVQSLTQELASLEQPLPALQQTIQETTTQLAQLEKDQQPLREQAEKLGLQIKEQSGGQKSLKWQQLSEAARSVEWTQRIAYAKQLLAWHEAKGAANQAKQNADSRRQERDAAEAERAALTASLAAVTERCEQLKQLSDEAELQSVARAAERDRMSARLQTLGTQRFVASSLQGLTPEQLAASTVVALGLDERFRAEATSEWQEKNKDKPPESLAAEQRAAEIESLYQQRCQQVEATFVSLFAAAPGTPQDGFQATVDQALFWANDGRIANWVAPGGGNLAERLVAMTDDQAVTEAAYRSLLSRLPDLDERQRIGEFLAAGKDDRSRAIQDLIWSLLTSVEFRFNH